MNIMSMIKDDTIMGCYQYDHDGNLSKIDQQNANQYNEELVASDEDCIVFVSDHDDDGSIIEDDANNKKQDALDDDDVIVLVSGDEEANRHVVVGGEGTEISSHHDKNRSVLKKRIERVRDENNKNDFTETTQADESDQANITKKASKKGGGEIILTKSSLENHIKTLVNQEQQHRRHGKILIGLVLFMSLAGAVTVYCITKHMEQDNFISHYHDQSNKLLDGIGQSIHTSLGALDSFANWITTTAHDTNQTFPFVTIPDFSWHAAKLQPFTGGLTTAYTPLITLDQRHAWEHYASSDNIYLDPKVREAFRYQETYEQYYGPPQPWNTSNYTINNHIFGDFEDSLPYYNETRPDHLPIYLPEWHVFPVIYTYYAAANYDWYAINNHQVLTDSVSQRKAMISPPYMIPDPNNIDDMKETAVWCEYYKDFIPPNENCQEPMSSWIYPIISNIPYMIDITKSPLYPQEAQVSAMIISEFYWKHIFKDILPNGFGSIVLVVQNACKTMSFTYEITGANTAYLGVGDLHDTRYHHMVVKTTLYDLLYTYHTGNSKFTNLPLDYNSCPFTFYVYPTRSMESTLESNMDVIYAISAAAFIIIPFLLFLAYDYQTSYRHRQIIESAEQSAAIVSSLFPDTIMKRLYPSPSTAIIPDDRNPTYDSSMTWKMMTANANPNTAGSAVSKEPIAEFYPDTTVLFADIADFTSWSSAREPSQVFTLLETIYSTFDQLAQMYNVFKVETVGDSYIAATGLPEPRSDHAVIMCQFGSEMLNNMAVVTLQLSTTLGPDTTNLTLRIGMNSGPTTAGVIRSTKCRFQLFGDTVNTASRMESNSRPGKMMCSQKTADLLVAAGYERWLRPRSELVAVKGKGSMQCYWCNPNAIDAMNQSIERRRSVSLDSRKETSPTLQQSHEQYIPWVTEMLQGVLKEVMVSRNCGKLQDSNEPIFVETVAFASPRDEVSETITMPRITNDVTNDEKTSMELPQMVSLQLFHYVSTIAAWYRKNPFHNFEHAAHVVMASKKLLKRVVKQVESQSSVTAYGITRDPLTQFAILFSALIHDVDHPGVSNAQLVKENSPIANIYSDKSVAEQNSVTLSWDLLMQEQFSDLRTVIMPTTEECKRFRQLVVNAVLATDLFDTELKSLRENRWIKAFSTDHDDHSNRRATIVIEHIIQAADVSHTMQHWHIYQKWNQRLLEEMYIAYMEGRSEKDPSIDWYQGELWFFDHYIIPLAMKLKTCGVFGVSCDEFLDYATANRAEWAAKGEEIVRNNMNEIKQSRTCHH